MKWQRITRPGGWNAARRQFAQYADRAWVWAGRRIIRSRRTHPFDGSPRFALLTVNFHTTRYLKLLLLTLSEQQFLGLIHRIVVCDNDSRDGGRAFLQELARRVPRVELIEHRRLLSHARGLRGCIRALDRVEVHLPARERCNLMLCSDTDVVFRSPETLIDLAGVAITHDAALIGEIRHGPNPTPDIQASFFVVRRDCYARRDVVPFVNDGSPAYRLQRSISAAGLTVVNFPTYSGGFVLHRGRSAVSATREFAPRSAYSTVPAVAHFMGVPDGARIWAEIEARHAPLLEPDAESQLLDTLSEKFEELGGIVVSD
jgi:hypothetical protein